MVIKCDKQVVIFRKMCKMERGLLQTTNRKVLHNLLIGTVVDPGMNINGHFSIFTFSIYKTVAYTGLIKLSTQSVFV